MFFVMIFSEKKLFSESTESLFVFFTWGEHFFLFSPLCAQRVSGRQCFEKPVELQTN